MSAEQLPSIPLGPADVDHPRRALARLALSSAAAELADSAAAAVPTVSDGYGSAYDDIEFARRLVSAAQAVLDRAVIHGRERGGSWNDIAEALGITVEETRERYEPIEQQWEDALDRPWEHSGPFLASRMPDGLSDPAQTVTYLDRWCTEHVSPNSGARSNARADGVEDRMVSANLPKHTPTTEANSVLRTAAYLQRRGAKATDDERGAFEARKAAVLGRAQEQIGGRR